MHGAIGPPSAVFLALTIVGGGSLSGAELNGRVRLTNKGQPAAGEVAHAVVYYFPDGGPTAPPAAEQTIVTRNKEFSPRVLTVTPGTPVRFPNLDPILHNVFSPSPANTFDVGLYREGPGEAVVLRNPGLVRLYCNVHHAMVAYVLVLETPHVASPDAQGRFRLSDLPAGEGELAVWHERTATWKAALTLPLRETLDIEIEITRRRVPPHLNKLGKPYTRTRRGDYD